MSESSPSPEMPESPLDQPIEEMDVDTLRGRIIKKVGCHERWGTRLTKSTLNSVYAYLTGEFHTPRYALHDTSRSSFATRREILVAVVFEAPIGSEQDRWSPVTAASPAKLNKEELRTLLETMFDRPDKRSWTPADAGRGGDGGE